jgi:hypothetical protein
MTNFATVHYFTHTAHNWCHRCQNHHRPYITFLCKKLSDQQLGCYVHQWHDTWASMVMTDKSMVREDLGLWVRSQPVTKVMHVQNKTKSVYTASVHTCIFLIWWEREQNIAWILHYSYAAIIGPILVIIGDNQWYNGYLCHEGMSYSLFRNRDKSLDHEKENDRKWQIPMRLKTLSTEKFKLH